MPTRLLNREFLLVTLTIFLLFMSLSAYFLLPRFFSDLGAGEAMIGALMGVGGISSGIAIPIVGVLVDRIGRRPLLLCGAVGMMIATGCYALTDSLLLVGAIRTLHGLAFAAMFVPAFTLVVDFSPEARRAQALAFAGVAGLAANALGPAAGEQVVALASFDVLFVATAAVAALALIPISMIPEPDRFEGSGSERSGWGEALSGGVVAPVLLTLVVGSGFGAMINFAADFTTKTGLVVVYPLLTAYSAGAIAVRILAGQVPDRVGYKRVAQPAVATYAAGLVVLASAQSIPGLVGAGLLIGVSHGFCYPALNALTLQRSSAVVRGRVMGLYTGAFNVGITASAFFFGALAQWQGYRVMYATAGLLVLASLVAFSLCDRRS